METAQHLLCCRPLRFDRHYPLSQTSLSVAEDIHNCCQGPINHPVSKRPCNGFCISTYVESERVCRQWEPLAARGLLAPGLSQDSPTLMHPICAMHDSQKPIALTCLTPARWLAHPTPHTYTNEVSPTFSHALIVKYYPCELKSTTSQSAVFALLS